MSRETWRQVIGHPWYEVSDHGRVRSYKQWRGSPVPRILIPTIGKKGYPFVGIDGIPGRQVHSLVLEAFVGPRPTGAVTRHLDGNRANSRLNNLAWGTRAENEADKINHGTDNRGERHGMAKLTTDQVKAIREAFGSHRVIADRFGICQSHVSVIRSGKAWAA